MFAFVVSIIHILEFDFIDALFVEVYSNDVILFVVRPQVFFHFSASPPHITTFVYCVYLPPSIGYPFWSPGNVLLVAVDNSRLFQRAGARRSC